MGKEIKGSEWINKQINLGGTTNVSQKGNKAKHGLGKSAFSHFPQYLYSAYWSIEK
jgi:hypothetical protein